MFETEHVQKGVEMTLSAHSAPQCFLRTETQPPVVLSDADLWRAAFATWAWFAGLAPIPVLMVLIAPSMAGTTIDPLPLVGSLILFVLVVALFAGVFAFIPTFLGWLVVLWLRRFLVDGRSAPELVAAGAVASGVTALVTVLVVSLVIPLVPLYVAAVITAALSGALGTRFAVRRAQPESTEESTS